MGTNPGFFRRHLVLIIVLLAAIVVMVAIIRIQDDVRERGRTGLNEVIQGIRVPSSS